MKKLNYLLILLAVISMSSCSSDDDSSTDEEQQGDCHCARHVYFLNEDEERTYFMTQEVTTDCDEPDGPDIEHESGRQVFYGNWDCAEIDDSNPIDPEDLSYNLTIEGQYQVDWCQETGNTSKIRISFLEDGSVKSSILGESDVEVEDSFEEILEGDIIGVKLELEDFNPNDLEAGSMGDGFNQMKLKITNIENETILIDQEVNGGRLYHCRDIGYEVTILYNTSTGEITTTVETSGF